MARQSLWTRLFGRDPRVERIRAEERMQRDRERTERSENFWDGVTDRTEARQEGATDRTRSRQRGATRRSVARGNASVARTEARNADGSVWNNAVSQAGAVAQTYVDGQYGREAAPAAVAPAGVSGTQVAIGGAVLAAVLFVASR